MKYFNKLILTLINNTKPMIHFILIFASLLGLAQNSLGREPVNIAAIYSLTGLGAISNRSSVLGTRLAVNEVNTRGGVLGRNLNLILLDNMTTPIGSSLAANQAVKANVAGIIGAQWSSHSLAIAEVAQQNKIPMISNFSTHPKLTRIGEYIFRVCFTDKFQGRVMADFAHQDLGGRSAIVLVDITSDYSMELSKIFREHFAKMGGKVVGEIEYKKKIKYNKLVRKILKHDADVIFLSGHEEGGEIADRLQKAGTKAILLGGDGWADKSFLELGGENLKQGYYCTHWSEYSDKAESRKFYEKYKGLDDFGIGAALAYDAVMVLVSAIEDAGTTDGEEVALALSGMTSFEGVTGTIKFNSNGDPVKSAVIMKIENGKPKFYKSFKPSPEN